MRKMKEISLLLDEVRDIRTLVIAGFLLTFILVGAVSIIFYISY